MKKDFYQNHSIEHRFVTGLSIIPFSGVYVCTFQPKNVTGWGSEGVKILWCSGGRFQTETCWTFSSSVLFMSFLGLHPPGRVHVLQWAVSSFSPAFHIYCHYPNTRFALSHTHNFSCLKKKKGGGGGGGQHSQQNLFQHIDSTPLFIKLLLITESSFLLTVHRDPESVSGLA